ncbi:MAG TPA: NAD(P)-dependent oxidoreductase [Longimicrobiales bacterium]|nr:NAD(P)-dependent oxidoreductase [Longimicrobiales bacterium]
MPRPTRVFLTGGTGLIGSHVAEQLRRRGDDVVALVRPTSDTTHLSATGCALVVGDVLDDVDAQAERMRGCDAVVHAAARVFLGGSRPTFLKENVDGTEHVLRAAALAAPRVIHLSSVAVYAGLPMDRPLTEERWTEADPERQNAYAASKHLSERAAWQLHDAGAIRLTTVRPSVVYGERDRAATPIMVRYATLPVVPLLAGGRLRLPLVYAGNVAAGVIAALDRPRAIGRAYNLALDEPARARDLVPWIGEELGRRRLAVTIPAALPRAAAAALEALGRVVPGAGRGGLRRAIRSLVIENPYDSSRARLELGWTGHVPHREGIRRTMAWWRSAGAG